MEEPARKHSLTRTLLFLAVAVLANSFGNLLLALGMNGMPDFGHVAFHRYLLGLVENPFLLPGAALTAVYTFTQMSLFSWADLSFVVPCISSSYIVSVLLGQFVLGEPVHTARWIGVALITVGVTLVMETPLATKPHGQEQVQP